MQNSDNIGFLYFSLFINSSLLCVCVFFLFLFLYSQVSLSCPYTRTDKFKYFTRTNFGVTSLADNYYYYHYLFLLLLLILLLTLFAVHTILVSGANKNDLVRVLSLSFSLASFLFLSLPIFANAAKRIAPQIASLCFALALSRIHARKYTPPSLFLSSLI